MNKVAAFFSVALLILPAVPPALTSSSPAPGVFSRTFDAGGTTLNLTAIYARSWNWDQNNTVRLTISRVSGSYNANALVLEATAVLHNDSNYFVLARPQASPDLADGSRFSLASPVNAAFSFTNDSYTSNAQQGKVYTAHIAIDVEMDVVSNGTSRIISYANGPGDMVITLNTQSPIDRTQEGSLIYLVASEIVGFAAIAFLMIAAKEGWKRSQDHVA